MDSPDQSEIQQQTPLMEKALSKSILSAAGQLINFPAADTDGVINAALKAIGEITGAERAYLYAYSSDRAAIHCTHEWINSRAKALDGYSTQASLLQNELAGRDSVLNIPDTEALPAETAAWHAELLRHGIYSLLAVPVLRQSMVQGWLSLEATSQPKAWSPEVQQLLQLAGNLFINGLENQRAQDALNGTLEDLRLRVDQRTQELDQANEALRAEIAFRQLAEQSALICEALHIEVFDNSPLQLFVIEVLADGRFRVLRTNPAHQHSSGMPPEKIWGRTVEEVVIPEVAAAINRHYQACVTSRAPVEYEETGPSPFWDVSRIRTFRTTLAPVLDQQGNVVRLVGASQDITEQKQAEEIVMNRAREEAVSAERGRLARELHDAVTQTLFSTTLTAEVLPKILERDPAEGLRKLEELRELTRGALAEMRTLLMELRPDALAEANLHDLLRHLANAFIARARIPIHVILNGACCPDFPVKKAFYRVAQESLMNIAKHSEASQAWLTLTSNDGTIELLIADDGQGFDAGEAAHADHHGLRIMRERAEGIGAEFQITSVLGQGTRLRMLWKAQ